MDNENIRLIIQHEYENGETMAFLSEKYNISVGTIKTWSFKYKWIKKKPNDKTKNRKRKKNQKTENQKKLQRENVNKELKIKQDILSDVPAKEIMEKYGIKKSVYYLKEKSIRGLIVGRNKMMLEEVSLTLIPDKMKKLKELKENKLKLLEQIQEAILDDEDEKIKQLNNRLSLFTKAEKEYLKELRIKVTYEESQFEKELTEEDIAKEKLEIEKMKIKNLGQQEETENQALNFLKELVGGKNETD